MIIKDRFASTLVLLADLSGKRMSEQLYDIYLKALEPLGLERVNEVLLTYVEKMKFPSIEDIRQALGSSSEAIDLEQSARILAQKVVEGIGKFGWPNEKDAEKWFGPANWEIVTKYLPWSQICDIESDQLQTFQAQFREFAIAYMQNKKHEAHLTLTGKGKDLVNSLLDSKIQKQIDEIPF